MNCICCFHSLLPFLMALLLLGLPEILSLQTFLYSQAISSLNLSKQTGLLGASLSPQTKVNGVVLQIEALMCTHVHYQGLVRCGWTILCVGKLDNC